MAFGKKDTNDQAEKEQQTIPFGNGVIVATQSDFVNGFQAGHLVYKTALEVHSEPYTDAYIVSLFLDKLEDLRFSSSYGVGFAVGWLKTLATKSGK